MDYQNSSLVLSTAPTDYLVDVLRFDLATLGWRRVILLGSLDDLSARGLTVGLARWGYQVLTLPEEDRAWAAEVLVQGDGAPEAMKMRLANLFEDGLEHGVEGIVVCDQSMLAAVGACVPQAKMLALSTHGDTCPVRNIVFDMGGVLFKWEPLAMSRRVSSSEEDAALLAEAVFGSQEWVWQDAGAVNEETVIWASKMRLPRRLHAQVEELVLHWHDHREAVAGIDDLIHDVKRAGYGVYLLSNAGESFDRYEAQLPGRSCFDGMVVSYREHVVKPDPRIYRALLERYHLVPEECLFVDDTTKNVLGARRVGMRAWHFVGCVEALRGVLLR